MIFRIDKKTKKINDSGTKERKKSESAAVRKGIDFRTGEFRTEEQSRRTEDTRYISIAKTRSRAHIRPVILLLSALAVLLFASFLPGAFGVSGSTGNIRDILNPASQTALTVENDSSKPWVEDGADSDGNVRYKTAIEGVGEGTTALTFRFTHTAGKGKLIFFYKISSEKNYDYFKVTYNGTQMGEQRDPGMSGNVDWTLYSLELAPSESEQTVELRYTKDSGGNSGADALWISNVGIFETEPVKTLSPTISLAMFEGGVRTEIGTVLSEGAPTEITEYSTSLTSDKTFEFSISGSETENLIALADGANLPITENKIVLSGIVGKSVINLKERVNGYLVDIFSFSLTVGELQDLWQGESSGVVFENDKAEPWVLSGSENGAVVFSNGNGPVNDPSESVLKATLPTAEGVQYVLSFDYRLLTNTNSNFLKVTLNGVALTTKDTPDMHGEVAWTTYSVKTDPALSAQVLEISMSKGYTFYESLAFIKCIRLNETELPAISLGYRDGTGGAVSVGKLFENGKALELGTVTRDFDAQPDRVYEFSLSGLGEGMNVYALVNHRDRIDAVEGKIVVDRMEGNYFLDFYAEKQGEYSLYLCEYEFRISCELNGLLNDATGGITPSNDKTYPWAVDTALSEERGTRVFKNTNQQRKLSSDKLKSFISLDIDVDEVGQYLLSFDYFVSSNPASGYEYLYVTLDGVEVTKPGWGLYGISKAWETFTVQVPAGRHKVEIGYSRSYSAPDMSPTSQYQDTAWISDVRLSNLAYPEIYFAMTEDGSRTDLGVVATGGKLIGCDVLALDYFQDIEREYFFEVSGLSQGSTVYVMCGERKFTLTEGRITVPGGDVTANFTVWLENGETAWQISEVVCDVFYNPLELVRESDVSLEGGNENQENPAAYSERLTSSQGYVVYQIVGQFENGSYIGGGLTFRYNVDKPCLMTFSAYQDITGSYNQGSRFILLLDGQERKDFTNSDKAWHDYAMMLGTGLHTVTLKYDDKGHSYGSDNCIAIGNIRFSAATLWGSGTAGDPYVVGGLNPILNAGMLSEFSQKLVFGESVSETYVKFADFVPDSASVSNGDASVEKAGDVFRISNVPASGVTKITFLYGEDTFFFELANPGIPGYDEITGAGTEENPYIISTEAHLKLLADYPDLYFRLSQDILLSAEWTPVGTEADPFRGGLDGAGYKISGLKISSGSYLGLFGWVMSAKIRDLVLEDVAISGENYLGALAGYAKNAVVSNVTIRNVAVTLRPYTGYAGGLCGRVESGSFRDIQISGLDMKQTQVNMNGAGGGVGGLVGEASATTGSIFQNITTHGSILSYGSNAGGLTGRGGGEWTDCYTDISLSGYRTLGGFVGGYQTSANFIGCVSAATVHVLAGFSQNYPYNGHFNGYGAWVSFQYRDSGLDLSGRYTSAQEISKIIVYNGNHNPNGQEIPFIKQGNTYVFRATVLVSDASASMDLLSETKENGVTGNYGGYTLRFVMADGTYKYDATYDRGTTTYRASLSGNLDQYTSYVDNFANMGLNLKIGTGEHRTENYNGRQVSIWGTVEVANANDFEHLSWVINGGIPLEIGGKYYNMRSVATISVSLLADIDLKAERTAVIGGKTVYLNRVGGNAGGTLIRNGFRGFGVNDMMPFRGSLYGNGHTLTVDMDFEDGYAVGIINIANEQSYEPVVSDLTVRGSIRGRERVGIVGLVNMYMVGSQKYRFRNVTNEADITADTDAAGLVGMPQSATIAVENCANYGTITARTRAAGLVGYTYGGGTVGNVKFEGISANGGCVIATDENGLKSYFALHTGTTEFGKDASVELIYTFDVGKANLPVTVDGKSYVSGADGRVRIAAVSASNVDDMKAITFASLPASFLLTDDFRLNGLTVQKEEALLSHVKVATGISYHADNVYDVTKSGENWVVKAVVTFSDGSTETVALTVNVEDSTTKIIFENVVPESADYDLSSLAPLTLKRVTVAMEEYVNAFAALAGLSGEEQKTAAAAADTKLKALEDTYTKAGTDELFRFLAYICNEISNIQNIDASRAVLNAYLGVAFAFESAEFVYDGTPKSLEVIGTKEGDMVDYTVNGVTDAGTYTVTATITPAGGGDQIVLTATLRILPYEFNAAVDRTAFVYSGEVQAPNFVNLGAENEGFLTVTYYSGDTELTEKPVDAGTYRAVIASENANNISIVGASEVTFVISPKEIALTIPERTETYSGKPIEFPSNLNPPSGVGVEVRYNGVAVAPTNAGKYAVTFVLTGEKSGNFVLKGEPGTLTILKKSIAVKPEAVSRAYGEADGNLGYSLSEPLCEGDGMDGALAREPGKEVGAYAILRGTLTAGDNYELTVEAGTFTILPKAITVTPEPAGFEYDGEEKTVLPRAEGLAYGETAEQVFRIEYEGDRVNAGSFTVRFVLLSDNYTLAEDSATVEIGKKDISELIEGLFGTSSDYDGTPKQMNVLLDAKYKYTLSYERNGAPADAVVNAGTYRVRVTIAEDNYKGEGVFEYTVNKAARPAPEVETPAAYGNKVVLPEGYLYRLGTGEWQTENEFTGLDGETEYTFFVKFPESENYLESAVAEVKVSTTLAVEDYREMVEALGAFEMEKYEEFREALLAQNRVSEYEREEIAADVAKLNAAFDAYRDSVREEAEVADTVADRALLNLVLALAAAGALAALGFAAVKFH